MRTIWTLCLASTLVVAGHGAVSADDAIATPGPSAAPASSVPPALSLAEFLLQVENHLVDVRQVELRQIESREKVKHLDQSRALEFEVDGRYQESDLDRLEINGANRKAGRLREVDRELTFAITRPILGRSLEDRLMVALEEQRQVELEYESELIRRSSLLEMIDLYLQIYETQESIRLLRPAVEKEVERERIVELRHARGESLRRDLLEATAELAARRLALVSAERLEMELQAELAERLVGAPLARFQAEPLDWPRLAEQLDGLSQPDAGSGADVATAGNGASGDAPAVGGSLWYNVPEIDLTLAYTIESLDRTFADERRRERGHSPEIQFTFEMPLDFYRSARAFRRQVAARQERRQLNLLVMERRMRGERAMMHLAVEEARRRLDVADARAALRDEELRVAGLRRAGGEVSGKLGADIEVFDAELAVIEAQIELTRARGDLARSFFEFQVHRGRAPAEMVGGLSTVVDDRRRTDP